MSTLPMLTIHFDPPDNQERVRLQLESSDTNQPLVCSLQLPFRQAQVPLVLHALNARQYPDYPTNERLVRRGEDRTQVVAELQALGLWDEERAAVAVDVHTRVGQRLGSALLAEQEAKQCFERFYAEARRVGWGELVLHFAPTTGVVAALPWEVAYDGEWPILIRHGFILSCTRVIANEDENAVRTPLPTYLPGQELRILTVAPRILMNSNNSILERFARTGMKEAFQSLPNVTIEALPQATMDALHQRLDQGPPVQVLDYFGHGTMIPKDGKVIGALVLENAQGGREEVRAEKLATLPNLPPIIALHACQSAWIDVAEPLNALALALSMAGVPLVLAMQLTVRTEAIADIAVPTFYNKIAAYQSIQQAIAAMRQALHNLEQDGVSWYVPVLYQRHPAPLFLLKRPNTYPDNPFASDTPACIIQREAEMRRLWQYLNAPSSLAIVGPAGSGKRTLLHLIYNEKVKLTAQPKVIWLELGPGTKLVDAQYQLARELIGPTATATDALFLLRQRNHVIILINNIGQMNQGESGLEVRLWLRSLTQDPNMTVRLVTTSMRPLRELFNADERESETYSPFHHVITNQITLEPFTEAEAVQFIEEALKGTSFRVQDFANFLGKRHLPRKLKELCKDRYDELCQRITLK